MPRVEPSVAELLVLNIAPAPPTNVILVLTLLVGSIMILIDHWRRLGAGRWRSRG